MQLHIENIGPIGSAKIDLTGLTVIGGLNDTGKSTIGKIYFSIIKAIRNKEQEYISIKSSRIISVISELTSELRGILGSRISPSSFDSVTRFFSEGVNNNDDIQLEIIEHELHRFKAYIYNEINRKVYRNHIEEDQIEPRLKKENKEAIVIIDKNIEKIKAIVLSKTESKEVYGTSFISMMTSVFKGEINNKRSNKNGSICLYDNDIIVFNSTFSRGHLSKFDINEDAMAYFFNDVTLLESPMVLNTANSNPYYPDSFALNHYGGYLSRDYTTGDLIRKIRYASAVKITTSKLDDSLETKISQMISNTINGIISYNDKNNEFIYSSNDKIQVKISNTASGVKALGILQMLARAGVLTGTNLLVVDEPEVHLHPEWQIVYAEIIALLVKKYNIYCLVSSHSPNFLQALDAYVKIYEMENLTKFYLSNKTDGSCYFEDITSNT